MTAVDIAAIVAGLFCLWLIWKITQFVMKLMFIGLLVALVYGYVQYGHLLN